MQRSIMCSVCKKAQTIITDPQSGEIICDCCGLVVLDKIPVRGPQWGIVGGVLTNDYNSYSEVTRKAKAIKKKPRPGNLIF
jgi:transcription initiation factor TFIIIB Brf1 subunit/transcription initiation factor TFIIB